MFVRIARAITIVVFGVILLSTRAACQFQCIAIPGQLTQTLVTTAVTTTFPTPWSVTLTGVGGLSPYSFSVTVGKSLPASFSLAGTQLSGTIVTNGYYELPLTATDNDGISCSVDAYLEVEGPPPLYINGAPSVPVTLVQGRNMTPIGLQVGGGYQQWTISGSEFPPGLTISALVSTPQFYATANVEGSPTQTGSYVSTITLADNMGDTLSTTITFNVITVTSRISYTVTTIDAPSGQTQPIAGTATTVSAMNASAEVVGTGAFIPGAEGYGSTQGFTWANYSFNPFSLPTELVYVKAINASGQVAGYAYNDGPNIAFVYSGGEFSMLGTLGGQSSLATAINDSGQVAGYSLLSNSVQHAFLYSGGAMQDLGTLYGPSGTSQATAINDAGMIVGTSTFMTGYSQQAFLYSNGEMVSLGPSTISPTTINNLGDVAGVMGTSGGWSDAFVYSGGVVTDLQTLGCTTLPGSAANSINSSKVIVGSSCGRAFVYQNGVMQDLDTLVDPSLGLQFTSALSINDAGQILVSGVSNNYILTPIGPSDPLSIVPLSLTQALVGQPYPTTVLSAAGGVPPYSWSAPGLPAGLTLSSSGTVAGIPTTPMVTPLSVTVSVSDADGNSATSPFSLSVCSIIPSLSQQSIDSNGGTLQLTVATVGPNCSWQVASDSPWASAASPTGTGSLAQPVSVAANSSGSSRIAYLTVAGVVLPILEQQTAQVYADVLPGAYYFDAVDLMSAKGITAGCGTDDYCPGIAVTRAQMAIFIVRAIIGSDDFTYTLTPYFTDVAPTDFGFQWIQKLKDLGITAGCSATMYCPQIAVTRDEMAIFIIRARYGASTAFEYSYSPYFTDVPTGDFAFPWIQRLKADNITAGCSTTTYCPLDTVLRQDMAMFIMRGAFNELLPSITPVITSVSPTVFSPGQTASLYVTGSGTNFQQGVTFANAIPGFSIGSLTVMSPTSLQIQLTAAEGPDDQPESVSVTTATESAVIPNVLSIP